MSRHDRSDMEIEGQMSIYDIFQPPERLIAVSRIFARAKKEMSLAEQKTFAYALSEMRFTEPAKTNYVRLDKKKLANIIGIHSDPDHLSVDLFENIKDLPVHSRIRIAKRDLDLYADGFVITGVISFKNIVRIRFNEDFMPLFTDLSTNYITMWSQDIFAMSSKRSVQFYEYLRQITDTRQGTNEVLLGIKALKEMFDIPKEGKGSYMRSKGGFDRVNFEKYVIAPLCEDLKKCKMINLLVQSDGKYYEKVKRGRFVEGYRFYWAYTSHPGVATAQEVHELQDRVDKNPQILKIAKDVAKGEKKPKKSKKQNAFNNFEQRKYDKNLESLLLGSPPKDED